MSCAISIIIPVYNVAAYLRQCLDSVLNQTLAEIQVICIDDGSTDGSAAILDEYARKDSRILAVHQANAGAYPARNAALKHVRGKYVLFVDADDWASPDLCKKAFYRAEQARADIVIFFWEYASAELETPDWGCCNLRDWNASAHRSPFPLEFGYLCQKLYRTEFIRRHGLSFDERYYCKVDAIFHWQTMSLAERVAVLPEILYHYRVHGTSITATIGKRYLEIVDVMFAIKKILVELGDPKGLLPHKWYDFALRFIHSACRQIKPEFRREMKQRIRESLGDDEREYYRKEGNLPRDVRCFYLSLESRWNDFRYDKMYRLRKGIASGIKGLLLPERLKSKLFTFICSHSYSLQHSPVDNLRQTIETLVEEADQLCEENYHLRKERETAAKVK